MKKLVRLFWLLGITFAKAQSPVTAIHTDFNGYWNTGKGTKPNTENNLLAFTWKSKTFSTGVNDAILTSNNVSFTPANYRALKIQSVKTTTSSFFLQGAMIDGSTSNRVLTPPIAGITSTQAELVSRLTDGPNGLALGTGLANIAEGSSYFYIGENNLTVGKINDGIPDILFTQVAAPDGTVVDKIKFVNASGTTIGKVLNIDFSSDDVKVLGTYNLDLFNVSDGTPSSSFKPNEERDIRILGFDFADFGITINNAYAVHRLVVSFSGKSDCAFIAVNTESLKPADIAVIKKGQLNGCGIAGNTIDYTFLVKNTGQSILTNSSLTDSKIGVNINIGNLNIGEEKTYQATYTITSSDVIKGYVASNAIIKGRDPSLTYVEDLSGNTYDDDDPTVTTFITTPTLGATTTANCTTGGSVVLNGLPSGTWTINQSGAATTSYTGTGSNYTVSGLAAGDYNFSLSIGSCTTASTPTVTIINPTITIWNGTTWSNGNPDETKTVIINGDYKITSDVTACSLTINPGIKITVPTGITFSVTNKISTYGQLIFENNASLIQSSNVKNEGTIDYQRTSSAMKNFDYTYWSSPVSGQTAKNLSPNTLWDKYHRYDPKSGWIFDDGEMMPGVGFIIRTPKEGIWPNGEEVVFPYQQNVTFTGVPNNGDYSFSVGENQFNLIGNPYPSAINATQFMTVNKDVIYGALYFWTHNTAISNNDYTADDYATFNGIGATATSLTNDSEEKNNVPNGYIAAGQSFFVGNTKAGNFIFNNAMRVAGNNSQFFKTSKNKMDTPTENHRIWLNLTNKEGAFKQLLVGYNSEATNDWDNLYDAPSFDGQTYIDFYSINNGQNLTIQGRSLPFEKTDEVPLGYRSTIEGLFEIGIHKKEGLLNTHEIWLEDKKLNLLHDLTQSNYAFTTLKGTDNERFVLKYYNSTLGTTDNEWTKNAVIVSVKNKIITVSSSSEPIKKIQIYDILGRLMYSNSKIDQQEWSINTLATSQQVLIVKTTLQNEQVSNNKIIF